MVVKSDGKIIFLSKVLHAQRAKSLVSLFSIYTIVLANCVIIYQWLTIKLVPKISYESTANNKTRTLLLKDTEIEIEASSFNGSVNNDNS